MNISVSTLKPNIVTTQLEANASIKAANTYMSATIAMVELDPYEVEALMMRFNATVFFKTDCQLRQILLSTQQLHFTLQAKNLL